MEFEEKDFNQARSNADSILNDGNKIRETFDDYDKVMTNVFGQQWLSSGSDNANSSYQTLRKNYEEFYNKIVLMKNHVYSVTDLNQADDAKAEKAFVEAMGE